MISDIDFKNYMKPVWQGNGVFRETVVFYENGSEPCNSVPLLYKPEEILSVQSYDLLHEYTDNDFRLTADGIERSPSSAIPVMPESAYLNTEDNNSLPQSVDDKGAVIVGKNDMVLKYYICVTYRHNEKWSGTVVPSQADRLPLFCDTLKNRKKAKIVFFGDSITVGCNASGLDVHTINPRFEPQYVKIGIPPYLPTWSELVTRQLELNYDAAISSANLAVGSTESSWGKQERNIDRIAEQGPDLLVIGFGMNECEIDPEKYKNNLTELMTAVKNRCLDTEFLLISTMPPTSLCFENQHLDLLENALYEIQDLKSEWHIAVTPINSVFRHIEKRKRVMDLLANNINHPNDFGVRIYAQTVSVSLSE